MRWIKTSQIIKSQIAVNNSRSSVWIILIFRKVYRFLSQNIRQRYFMEKYNRHKVCDTLLISNKKLPLCSKYFVRQNTKWQSGCKYPIVQYISLTSRETGDKKNIFLENLNLTEGWCWVTFNWENQFPSCQLHTKNFLSFQCLRCCAQKKP